VDLAGRVNYLLARGGVESVLEEVSKIQSGNSRGLYIRELAGHSEVELEHVVRLTQLASQIDSASELSKALELLIPLYPEDSALTTEIVSAVSGIASSSGRRQALEAVIEGRILSR